MSEKEYLVKLTPLEPYFFGGERNNYFTQERSYQKNDYFIRSELLPSQTTLLGMLRFLVLQEKGLLNGNKNNDKGLPEKQMQIIGRSSFQIDSESEQNFGVIKRLSPKFLISGENKYIPLPLNHNNDSCKYSPFEMIRNADGLITENGEGSLFPNWNSGKHYILEGFMNVSEHNKIVYNKDLFRQHVRTRIYKKSTKEGFFKRAYIDLEDSFSIGFYVVLDGQSLPSKEIVYLGKNKSAFAFECVLRDNDLDTDLINVRLNSETPVYYALSDVRFNRPVKDIISYSIVLKNTYRNIYTDLARTSGTGRLKLSSMYQMVKAGSVFYVRRERVKEFEGSFDNINCKKIGLNQIYQLG